ncbi:hypothetical protein B0A48_13213 [Cryoendolithus antarcticus]|uniref:Carboxymuconolactone decarboxylase-like domain-containing protein n=1 Tax=Cryoendolithus antarcticus TaxID=1507870 RepID=A0A1V8SP93_9PEZI|nr:hypothetical protein B0A48_13213 [Cryoendolithus antarcticus]
MSTQSPELAPDFFDQVEDLPDKDATVRWYYCVIVNLAALNYPELVPQIWKHLAEHVIAPLDHDAQFAIARKLREALIKSCGIMGAAKTGTAIRLLCQQIPKELRDPATPRADEDPIVASTRGHAFHRRIYGRNQEFDYNATGQASPDYAWVVRDLMYGRIFSYDGILSDLDTGYVIVSALIGIDCHIQLRHHMKGMLYNGATRAELEELYKTMLNLAERLGVKFRSGLREIPSIEPQT